MREMMRSVKTLTAALPALQTNYRNNENMFFRIENLLRIYAVSMK